MSGFEQAEYLVQKLREILATPLPGSEAQTRMAPSVRSDLLGNSAPNAQTRRSAVLIMLYPKNGTLYFPLIKRQTYDGPHSGQISLPGGKFEEGDETLHHTALRESYEEIGVDTSKIEVLGELSLLYIPVSNLCVKPVVGYLANTPTFLPNLQEVEYIIEAPLEHLTMEQYKSVKVITSHGRPVTAPYYNLCGEMVWGATAMILSELEAVVRG